jgi:hypothetical protein
MSEEIKLIESWPDMTLEKAIEQVYHWQFGNSDNFSSKLFDLFMKADVENYARLARGFPSRAIALSLWRNSKDTKAFFKKHMVE